MITRWKALQTFWFCSAGDDDWLFDWLIIHIHSLCSSQSQLRVAMRDKRKLYKMGLQIAQWIVSHSLLGICEEKVNVLAEPQVATVFKHQAEVTSWICFTQQSPSSQPKAFFFIKDTPPTENKVNHHSLNYDFFFFFF